jgi:hypothetical protein
MRATARETRHERPLPTREVNAMSEQPTATSAPAEGARDGYGYGGEREPAPREGRYQPPAWVRVIGIGLIVGIVLLLCGSVATGALALLAYSSPAASATSAQSFAVGQTPSVVVRAQAGTVSVVAGGAGQVAVRVTKSARAITASLSRQALNGIRVTNTQAGDTVTVAESVDPLDFWPARLSREVQIELTVPAATNLEATLNAGTFSADRLQGTAVVRSNAGTITFNNAQLSDASLHTDAGSIELDQVVLSGDAHLSSNAGSITLQGSLAPHTALDATTNAGSVSLTLPATTSAHLEASTNVGDVSIQGFPITVQHVFARSSASGDLAPNPTGSIIIHTNAGSVSVVEG